MFKRLHKQFALFSTGITSLILAAMTFVCLFISETDASRESYLTFHTNTNTMLSYLSSQSIISHQWLLEMEDNYGVHIRITDNGKELFYRTLDSGTKAPRLFALAEEKAAESYGVDVSDSNRNQYTANTAVFTLDIPSCYAAVSLLPRESGSLSATVVYPLDREREQVLRRRMLFLGAAGCGVLLLWIFSWFFTRRLIKPLEEGQKKQNQFIAAASHELRTPLAVILSSTSALRGTPPKKQEQFLSHIQEEGERMNRLIGDLLSLSSADSQSWAIHPERAEPDTLLLNIYEKYQPLAHEKGLHWNVLLPDTPVPVQHWDSGRISQVLGILADNAVSYTPSGGSVSLELHMKKGGLEYRICDSGPGIPDKEKSAVFQRFYRLDESHHDKEHFGLGLCIAEEIVGMHKGRISVEDTPGGGASFVVRLQTNVYSINR